MQNNKTSSGFAPFASREDGKIYCEDVPLETLAKDYGTPLFVYSQKTLEENYQLYLEAVSAKNNTSKNKSPKLCYAVKANSNLSILKIFKGLGAGFDTVSLGEMHRAMLAGAKGNDIVLSGVGKSYEELSFAIDNEIGCICLESWQEYQRTLEILASKNKPAKIAVRVNPEVTADTHPNITTGGKEHKFGVDSTSAMDILRDAHKRDKLEIIGISCHIGSQILSIEPFISTAHKMHKIYKDLAAEGITLAKVGLGGGFGISYKKGSESSLEPKQCAKLLEIFDDTDADIFLEPGRSLVASSSVLLSKVEYVKLGQSKNFIVVDAAMNDFIRPSLYDAYHEVYPAQQGTSKDDEASEPRLYDIVGPVCETGDFLAKDRAIKVAAGDLLCIGDAGAYGMSMSSNYNSRPRPAEVLVNGSSVRLISRREALSDLWRHEIDL